MKKIVLFLTFCSVLIAFSGCKKDEPAPKNQITLDGTSYDISTTGIILTDQGEMTSGSIVLGSTSSSKTIQVQLEFMFKTASGISGTYELGQNLTRYLLATSAYYVTTIGKGTVKEPFTNPTAATLTITDKGSNNYEITFKLKPATGSEIEGYYAGDIVPI